MRIAFITMGRTLAMLALLTAGCASTAKTRTTPADVSGAGAPVAREPSYDGLIRPDPPAEYVREDVALRDVLAEIEKWTPLHVRWDELAAVGVRADTPVTVRARNGTRPVLEAVREQLGPGKLDFGWDDGWRLLITTERDQIARRGLRCEYDCAEFLQFGFDAPGRDCLMAEIGVLVIETVAPESWHAPNRAEVERRLETGVRSGGDADDGNDDAPEPPPPPFPVPDPTGAYLTWAGSRMTIRHTPERQRQVAALFEQMRQSYPRLELPILLTP